MTTTKLQAEINSLPEHLKQEVADFVAFLAAKYSKKTKSQQSNLTNNKTEQLDDIHYLKALQNEELQNIQKINSSSQAFEFLANEEDLYSKEDIIEKYHG